VGASLTCEVACPCDEWIGVHCAQTGLVVVMDQLCQDTGSLGIGSVGRCESDAGAP
jgi:hypothetical protein